MKSLNRGAACVCMLLAVASVTRCGPGQRYHSARRAEERGDVHLAYDDYCRAARYRAGNGSVTAGIKRTSAAAAAHWESQARTAMADGHRPNAWRMWMRVLEIRPDHATAAQEIRRLEERHGSALRAARNEWLRLGSTALALAPPTVPLPDREVSEQPPVLASARPADEDQPPAEPIASDEEALTSLANASADRIEGMVAVSTRSDTIVLAPALAIATGVDGGHPGDAEFNPQRAGSIADVSAAVPTDDDDSPESAVTEPEPPDLNARNDQADVVVAPGAEGVEPAGMLATARAPDDGSSPVDTRVFTRPPDPEPVMTDARPQDIEGSGSDTRIAMAENRDEAQAAASEDGALVFGPSPRPPAETGHAEAASVESEVVLPETAQTTEPIEQPPASGALTGNTDAESGSERRIPQQTDPPAAEVAVAVLHEANAKRYDDTIGPPAAAGDQIEANVATGRAGSLGAAADGEAASSSEAVAETLRDRDVAEPIGDVPADSAGPANARAQAANLPTVTVGAEPTRHKPDDRSDRAREASVAGRLPVVRVGPEAADLLLEQVAEVTRKQGAAKELPVVPVDPGPAVGKPDDEDRSVDATISAQARSGQRPPVAQRAPDPGPEQRIDVPSARSSGDILQPAQNQTGTGVFSLKAAPDSDKASPSSRLRKPADPKPRTVWRLQERSARRGEFLSVQTLSKKDPRYPRRAHLVGDISARLRDTDGDLDADLDLYDGERRIKKIRELPVGRSQTFRSRFGTRYRLTVLGVHHETRTVRVGIKSAR